MAREKTVLQAGPCLLGLYAVVAVLFHALPEAKRAGAVSWPGKATANLLRRPVRRPPVAIGRSHFATGRGATALQELPAPVRELLLATLAPAA